VYIKKPQEIALIVEGGALLGAILEQLTHMVGPGVSCFEIDQSAERLIVAAGGRPAFKGYKTRPSDPPFPSTICASINHELVHGIATKEKILHEGDIFSIDIGMEWPVSVPTAIGASAGASRGYFTDTAITVAVGGIPKEVQKLIEVTQEALEVGIRETRPGNTIADIGRAIEAYVRSQGAYGIIEELVGHGVGHSVHEEPRVPNYYDAEFESWVIRPGVVIAIEPMISLGSRFIETASDGWTISPQDKSLSAHFEHTIAITEGGPVVVTRRPGEKHAMT